MIPNGCILMARFLKSLIVDTHGADMIEYALLAATLTLVVAAFLPPTLMPAVSTIFSKITSEFSAS